MGTQQSEGTLARLGRVMTRLGFREEFLAGLVRMSVNGKLGWAALDRLFRGIENESGKTGGENAAENESSQTGPAPQEAGRRRLKIVKSGKTHRAR